jgi:ferredoxin
LCALHATIRAKVFDTSIINGKPDTFKIVKYRGKEYGEGMSYTLQVAVEDCTGCAICVEVCPAKNKKETRLKAINMHEQEPLRDAERTNLEYFLSLPEIDRRKINIGAVKDSQFLEPLFEFSGACSGCGETPYVKLVSQMFGDRAVIANATGVFHIRRKPSDHHGVLTKMTRPRMEQFCLKIIEFGLGSALQSISIMNTKQILKSLRLKLEKL